MSRWAFAISVLTRMSGRCSPLTASPAAIWFVFIHTPLLRHPFPLPRRHPRIRSFHRISTARISTTHMATIRMATTPMMMMTDHSSTMPSDVYARRAPRSKPGAPDCSSAPIALGSLLHDMRRTSLLCGSGPACGVSPSASHGWVCVRYARRPVSRAPASLANKCAISMCGNRHVHATHSHVHGHLVAGTRAQTESYAFMRTLDVRRS